MRGGGNSLLDLCDLSKTHTYKKSRYYDSHNFDLPLQHYDSHNLDSRGLDTSLHCVPLSMTNRAHSVILSLCKMRSIHFSNLKLKAIRLPYTNLNAIALIRFYVIDFICNLDSRGLDSSRYRAQNDEVECGLDTSLRINATLSMTNRHHPVIPNESNLHSVILSLCKRRSIHFSDFRIAKDSLTLSESAYLRFTRFATFHTTHKGIAMQT